MNIQVMQDETYDRGEFVPPTWSSRSVVDAIITSVRIGQPDGTVWLIRSAILRIDTERENITITSVGGNQWTLKGRVIGTTV